MSDGFVYTCPAGVGGMHDSIEQAIKSVPYWDCYGTDTVRVEKWAPISENGVRRLCETFLVHVKTFSKKGAR